MFENSVSAAAALNEVVAGLSNNGWRADARLFLLEMFQ